MSDGTGLGQLLFDFDLGLAEPAGLECVSD
jgi:hypothetical protein